MLDVCVNLVGKEYKCMRESGLSCFSPGGFVFWSAGPTNGVKSSRSECQKMFMELHGRLVSPPYLRMNYASKVARCPCGTHRFTRNGISRICL
jgi:hypothetical protein